MENRIKVLNLLGLARRASKLVTGQELVLSRIRSNKVSIDFVASDSGKNSLKQFTDKCKSYNVFLCKSFTKEELSSAIGQKRSVIAVNDIGFANRMKELLSD